ncbi:GDSL-type esterase/lipase family protein [Actinomycetes bacterium KLBMP 9759]
MSGRRLAAAVAAVLRRRDRASRMVACHAVGLVLVTTLGSALGMAVAEPPTPPVVRPAADDCGPTWTTGWHAAVQPAPAGDLRGATLRMIVHPQVTGSEVRVRLSNEFGATPLVIGTVSAARSSGGAAVVPGTLRPATFGGRNDVVVPAGGQVVSDPVRLVAEAGTPIAVSLYLPLVPATVAQHPNALQTSYLARGGDAALATAGAGFATAVGSWTVLTGLDVHVPRPVRALVALGDSITDGIGSPADTNGRWSDALAARLNGTGGAAGMAVLNAGLSRNRLLRDAAAVDGDSPLTRYARDVAGTGASDVVLHIGTNDIADGRPADQIVAGMVAFAQRARADGKRVFLTTITPSTTGAHGTPAAAATRDAVNAWVLRQGREHADGVFDFAAAVADPAAPSRLARPFDAGDGLHLSATGYQALANTVDIAALSGSPCLTDASPVRLLVSAN